MTFYQIDQLKGQMMWECLFLPFLPYSYLSETCPRYFCCDTWIGARDHVEEGVFQWTNMVFTRRSEIPKDSERSPCKRNWLIIASTLRLVSFLERTNGALVALLDTLLRCHGDLTPLLRRVHQNAEPRRVLCVGGGGLFNFEK